MLERFVVSSCLTRHRDVQSVVEIVIPIGGEQACTTFIGRQQVCAIGRVLDDQVNRSIRDLPAHRFGHFPQDVAAAGVFDLIDRVQPQTVEAKFLQPVQDIIDKEPPNRIPREGDFWSPGGWIVCEKEIRRVVFDVISDRPEVIVDDVENDHHSMTMLHRQGL